MPAIKPYPTIERYLHACLRTPNFLQSRTYSQHTCKIYRAVKVVSRIVANGNDYAYVGSGTFVVLTDSGRLAETLADTSTAPESDNLAVTLGVVGYGTVIVLVPARIVLVRCKVVVLVVSGATDLKENQ